MTYELNAVNRGMYIADNLDFLKSLNDECIDLVCIDPPFAKNETFGRKSDNAADPLKPPLTDEERQIELDLLARWGIHNAREADAAGIDWPETRYKDFWSWEKDVHEDWLADIEQNHRPIKELIEATQYVHGSDTAAYLCYMAVRLFEIRRVLKDTGSLYLHCDHTANGYLRQLLDGVFGRDNFRNEIVWHYYNKMHDRRKRLHPAATDTIFFYVKNVKAKFAFHQLTEPREKPVRQLMRRKVNGQMVNARDEDGKLMYQTKTERTLSNVWNIPMLQPASKERLGYPTQKPVALAERIIKASSNPGDVVLDCFAGCAYVAVAAERTGRKWVACDINPRAWTVFKRQFSKPKLALLNCAEPGSNPNLSGAVVTVNGPTELPERISPDAADTPSAFTLPERKFKVASSIFTKPEMLEYLLQLSGWKAWCCGFANRRPDGTIVETSNNFHLDHIDPLSKDGANEIYNRAPLCPYHNIRKGNRRIHLDDYRKEIADAGEMLVDNVNDLVNLPEVNQTVQLYWAQQLMVRKPQLALPSS